MSLFNAARDLASLGLSVVPVAGKKPVVRWKPVADGRRPSPAELRDWFSRPGVTGVAVLCGPASGGLTVGDFDDYGAYLAWRRGFPDVAGSLPASRTRRGAHVWFRSKLTKTACCGWGELKASGIVVAPPSLHPDGGEYAWLSDPPRWDIPFIEPATVGLLDHATQDAPGATQATQDDLCYIPPASCVTPAALPSRPGERNRAVWRLVQVLKGDPRLSGLPCDHADVVARFDAWHAEAARVVGTPDRATSWSDFRRGWAACRFPRGALLGRVIETIPRDCQPLDRLRAVCHSLAAGSAEASFFLSCRTAAALVGGIDHIQAWRLLSTLRKAGELVLVRRGVRPLASEWRLRKKS